MDNNPKRSKELETAKETLYRYGCDKFTMHRSKYEGFPDYKNYKKLRISKAQEDEWIREYIEHWRGQLKQLSCNDLSAVTRLARIAASEALPDIIEVADRGDSYTKLFYGIHLAEIANRDSDPNTSEIMREKALDTAYSLWHSLIDQPIELTKENREKISPEMMEALEASTPEEYLVNYARRKQIEITSKTAMSSIEYTSNPANSSISSIVSLSNVLSVLTLILIILFLY